MYLDFMTHEVWNGLVIGVTLVGVAFAVLRLLRDWNLYRLRRQWSDRPANRSSGYGEDAMLSQKDDRP